MLIWDCLGSLESLIGLDSLGGFGLFRMVWVESALLGSLGSSPHLSSTLRTCARRPRSLARRCPSSCTVEQCSHQVWYTSNAELLIFFFQLIASLCRLMNMQQHYQLIHGMLWRKA